MLGISIGIYPRDGNIAEELLQFSYQTMYKAKTKKKTKNPLDNDG